MNKAAIFMGASWSGLAGVLVVSAGSVFLIPAEVKTIGIAAIIFSSFAMLFTRRADEYTERLWNAGSSMALGALLLLTAGLGFVEGFIEGVTDSPIERSISADAALTISIAAFYLGLFVRRVRGDM